MAARANQLIHAGFLRAGRGFRGARLWHGVSIKCEGVMVKEALAEQNRVAGVGRLDYRSGKKDCKREQKQNYLKPEDAPRIVAL